MWQRKREREWLQRLVLPLATLSLLWKIVTHTPFNSIFSQQGSLHMTASVIILSVLKYLLIPPALTAIKFKIVSTSSMIVLYLIPSVMRSESSLIHSFFLLFHEVWWDGDWFDIFGGRNKVSFPVVVADVVDSSIIISLNKYIDHTSIIHHSNSTNPTYNTIFTLSFTCHAYLCSSFSPVPMSSL